MKKEIFDYYKIPSDVNVMCGDKYCLNCSSFDGSYHGGYCDYHKQDTNPSGYCSSWS